MAAVEHGGHRFHGGLLVLEARVVLHYDVLAGGSTHQGSGRAGFLENPGEHLAERRTMLGHSLHPLFLWHSPLHHAGSVVPALVELAVVQQGEPNVDGSAGGNFSTRLNWRFGLNRHCRDAVRLLCHQGTHTTECTKERRQKDLHGTKG